MARFACYNHKMDFCLVRPIPSAKIQNIVKPNPHRGPHVPPNFSVSLLDQDSTVIMYGAVSGMLVGTLHSHSGKIADYAACIVVQFTELSKPRPGNSGSIHLLQTDEGLHPIGVHRYLDKMSTDGVYMAGGTPLTQIVSHFESIDVEVGIADWN